MESQAKLIEELDINEYHQMPGISATGINLILDCPKRYWHEYMNPLRQGKDSAAYMLGRAVHMLILETDKFHEKFYCMDEKVNLTTKVGKEVYENAKHIANRREILRLDDVISVKEIATSVLNHSVWKRVGLGKVEHSLFFEGGTYTTPLKSRPDFYTDKIIIDVKTTDSIPGFMRSIYSYGYHRQAAMQVDALFKLDGKARNFSFLAVEKKAPYLCSWISLDEASIDKGREDYLHGADLYSECLLNDEWPGYGGSEELCIQASLPKWLNSGENF